MMCCYPACHNIKRFLREGELFRFAKCKAYIFVPLASDELFCFI